jgi:hypothetical protein
VVFLKNQCYYQFFNINWQSFELKSHFLPNILAKICIYKIITSVPGTEFITLTSQSLMQKYQMNISLL